jgi:hypothetical protein
MRLYILFTLIVTLLGNSHNSLSGSDWRRIFIIAKRPTDYHVSVEPAATTLPLLVITVCIQAAFLYILECLWLPHAVHLLFYFCASKTVIYMEYIAILCKLCEPVFGDVQFAVGNLKDFVLEILYPFACVYRAGQPAWFVSRL